MPLRILVLPRPEVCYSLRQVLAKLRGRAKTLVGACLATGDRIFATGSASVSINCFAILWLFLLDFRACNHGSKGPQKPKTYCDNSSFAILSFTPVLIVRSGPAWRQHLPTTAKTLGITVPKSRKKSLSYPILRKMYAVNRNSGNI